MPASVSRPAAENTPEKIRARLDSLQNSKPEAKEEVHELPRWVKTALVQRAVDGLTYKEAAGRVGKSAGTLSAYARSPAAKKWLEKLYEFLEDPVAMAKAYMGANALSITMERFAFLEAAIAAGDYKEGDRIARDIQDRLGLVAPKSKDSGSMTIKLQVGGGGPIEVPAIETAYELVGDDD